MNGKVAIVILNYNGEEMLGRFLPSVLDYSAGARVVVADNGSTDASISLVRNAFPSVEIIELGSNYGYAGGYNRALEHIDAPYYMLLNSDVEVTQGWLQPLLAIMESNSSVAACQPKILSFHNRCCFEYAGAAGGFIDGYGYPYCRGRVFGTVEEDKGQYDSPCPVFWATGAALMVRSSVFRAVGGFDDRFFAHMEEIDLCWRINARGGVVMAVPGSVVYHVGGATLDKSNPRKTYLNFRNNLLMLYKNLPTDKLTAVMRVRAVLDYIAAFKFLLCGSFGDFGAVIKARRHYAAMKKDFLQSREENIAKSVCSTLNGQSSFSLLWRYYIGRKHCFSQLNR